MQKLSGLVLVSEVVDCRSASAGTSEFLAESLARSIAMEASSCKGAHAEVMRWQKLDDLNVTTCSGLCCPAMCTTLSDPTQCSLGSQCQTPPSIRGTMPVPTNPPSITRFIQEHPGESLETPSR